MFHQLNCFVRCLTKQVLCNGFHNISNILIISKFQYICLCLLFDKFAFISIYNQLYLEINSTYGGTGDNYGGTGENNGGTGNEYCNTGDNSCGTGDNNDTGDNNNNTGNNISDTGYNNSVTDDSNTNSDTGCDRRCGASDSGASDGSGLSHSHCCNHKIYGVYETATSSTGQSPGPASVPHKMRQAGHHDNLPD